MVVVVLLDADGGGDAEVRVGVRKGSREEEGMDMDGSSMLEVGTVSICGASIEKFSRPALRWAGNQRRISASVHSIVRRGTRDVWLLGVCPVVADAVDLRKAWRGHRTNDLEGDKNVLPGSGERDSKGFSV